MIRRQIEPQIEALIGRGKAITIMGARQVGKSTLLHQLFNYRDDVLWLSGDDVDVQDMFATMTAPRMKMLLGKKNVLVVDEAQRIPEIGLRLKAVIDQLPEVQVVATGSSSFQLASKVNEPLTGRKREFKMYPVSFREMVEHTDLLTEKRMIPHRMTFGYYPEAVTSPGEEREVLSEISSSYLYKDILQIDGINKPEKLEKLLHVLARQIGDQISYREIGQLIDLDSKTVERYIDILEKNFVVFRLGSFARNLRNELKSSKKIYFYDLGIRNAVISDFRAPEIRNDVGAMWENFVVSERIKQLAYNRRSRNIRFWRTVTQKEIDIIEEADGAISAYEINWNPRKTVRAPAAFSASYPGTTYRVITPKNIEDYLLMTEE